MPLSRLKPDTATGIGILTAAGVFLIYQNAMPSLADIRVAPANDDTVEATRKHAAYLSAGLIALTFLVSRDLNSYIISGAALVGIDYLHKHNNGINPHTQKLDVPVPASADNVASFPMPQYEESAQ